MLMSTPPSVIKKNQKCNLLLLKLLIFKLIIKNLFKISYNEEIMLFEISEEESSFPQIEFSLYHSLNELSKINKYFRHIDNLQEVYIAFKVLIKNNNLSIIKEE